MKRINYNCFLFIVAIVFILLGYRQDYKDSLTNELERFENGFKYDFYGSFDEFKENVEKISDEKVRYHNALVDLNSIRENILGTRVIIKPDTTVVKADSGSLIIPDYKISKEDTAEVVSRLKELNQFVKECGLQFLYCAAPSKAMYEKEPANIQNHASENMDVFLSELQKAEIPYVDFRETFKERNIETQDIFYYTDHHWTIRSGLIATQAICEKLNDLYGFDYNTMYTDIRNYKTTILKDWLLGSYGKKVGRFFTRQGADDFEVIVPRFETDMTEEQPFINEHRHGAFEDTVMYLSNLEKGLHFKNAYAAYSGGDFHLQIMRNNMLKEGKRILLIRDSFACAVAPFLALQTRELDICDMRDADYVSGERLDLRTYIERTKPDYVIVLYSGTSTVRSSGKYDFID